MRSLFRKFDPAQPRDGLGRWASIAGEVLVTGVGSHALTNLLGGSHAAPGGRERGQGERLARAAAGGTALYNSPRIARVVRGTLVRAGMKRYPALGAALLAGSSAISGAREIGGYAGRKVDEAVDRVFKGTVEQTMGEFKRGKLRSGSKHGPKVTDRRQAVASGPVE